MRHSRIICKECDHVTFSKKDLQRHKKSHHGIRYSCSQCPFNTKQRSNLRRHRNSIHESRQTQKHTQKSHEYLCSQCSYKTNRKDSLKRHIKAIHEVPISKTELSLNKQGKQTRKEIPISPHPGKKSGSGNDRKNLVDNHITNPGTGIDKSSTKESQTNICEPNNT